MNTKDFQARISPQQIEAMYEDQLERYKRENFRFWTRQYPLYALATFAICFLFVWGVFAAASAAGFDTTGSLSWPAIATLLAIPPLFPIVWGMAPKKPTRETIEENEALRLIGKRLREQDTAQRRE